MRLGDSEIKSMYVKIGDIYTITKVIETKVKSMEKHMETQNSRLNKHANEIGDLKVQDANFKGQASVFLLVGGGVGGLIAGVIMFLIQMFLGG